VRTVEFAGAAIENVPASLDLGGEGAFDTDRTRANIGMGILRRFRLQLDFHDNVLYAVPNDSAVKQVFGKNRAGLIARFIPSQATNQASSLVVMMVAPSSPAARSGDWKTGDTIVSINGEPLTPDVWAKKWWNWSQGDPGTKIVLGLSGGETRELVLADYY
jgi:hypothetical protein